MEAKRGRPQHPEPVTPAEARVLELLRSGKPNAEIAVRLGVSVNTVRYHVSNLLAKAGVEDRRQLADWTPRQERASRRGWALLGSWKLLAGIGGAGLVVFAGSALLLRGRDGDEPAIAVADSAPQRTATPRSAVIAGRTMLDAGRLFVTTDPNVVIRGETRETLLVLELSVPSAEIKMGGAIDWATSWESGAMGSMNAGGKRAFVGLQPATADTSLVTDAVPPSQHPARLEVRSVREGAPAVLMLWVQDHHVEFGHDGHLYIEEAPTAPGAVVAMDTGERLDVSRTTKLGPLDGAWTLCASWGPGPCFVIAYFGKGPVLAPFAGVFRCRPDGIDELTSTALRLEFRHLQAGREDLPCDPAGGPPRDVQAGEALFPSIHTLVTAFDGLGAKTVNLVVSNDGTLYAGPIPRRFDCPCRTGN